MPPKPTEIWGAFHRKRPANVRIDIELEENWSLTKKEAWFEAALASGLDKKKDVNGEKGVMAGHLQRCEFVTVKEKGIAAQAAPVKKEKEQGEKGKCKQTEEGAEADDKVRMVGAAIGRMQWVVSKSLLTSILCINKWQKDGESLKQQFEEMIDEAERTLECNVIGFLTDNDGGSKKAQTLLEAARAWLLTFPCCTHQGQLLLGDYLKENEDATILMGKLIDFVNWLNSHDKVRDDKQQ
ncbi:hypothetical protein C8J57DRAFT_1532093 [Mycena rebaudengoi]|nr:hypothetical protein C8J57DRAFT_1532093 [Mycena rebaudengoi]